MEALIENYRGFEIRFNTEKETFVCDIDDARSIKKSYPALKKFIDEFIKDNSTFIPTWFVKKPGANFGAERIKVVGIRKDGRYIYETEGGGKKQLSDYYVKNYMQEIPENKLTIEAIAAEREALQEYQKSHNERVEELQATLVIKSLVGYGKD